MIKLRGKEGVNDPLNKIVFEPRPGFVRGAGKAQELEFPLIYGHRCPYCSNVIQALFKAPKEFSLWPYEETTVLSQGDKNSGEVLKVFPDDKTKHGKSCYRIEYSPAEGGSIKLTLKNHLTRHATIVERKYDGNGIWEAGEKPCTKTGIFSIREDLLMKDFLLFSQLTDTEVSQHNMPTVKEFIPEGDTNFKLVPSVGQAPPVILVERQSLVYGFHYHTRQRIQPFRKTGK